MPYVGRRPCFDQGESGVTGLDEQIFTWPRRKLPNGTGTKNEEAGCSQHLVGTFPSPALITAKNLAFLEKEEAATLGVQSKAHRLLSTLSAATDKVLLLLRFPSEQGVLVSQSAVGTP